MAEVDGLRMMHHRRPLLAPRIIRSARYFNVSSTIRQLNFSPRPRT